jgi:hypothetical protein
MSLLLDSEKENSSPRPDSPVPYDLDSAFVDLVEKIEIDWPEFIPVECIRAGITKIAFGLLLVVGLAALCAYYWR